MSDLNSSQELCNFNEVRLLEIFEARERFVEILRQVEHFLRDLDDLIFGGLRSLHKLLHDVVVDERIPLELLHDFEGDIECANSDERGFAARKLIVMHGHLAQVHRHLEDEKLEALGRTARFRHRFFLLGRQASLAYVTDLENLLQIVAKEVKDSWGWDLVVDDLKDIELEGLDILDRELLVSDLLEHHLHFKWVNVFVFARNKHRGDADDVQVTDFSRITLILEVSIKERHSEEECLVVALKVGQDLNHPIDHARTQSWSDFVFHQAVGSEGLDLEVAHILHDRIAILRRDVNVLPFDLSGCKPREMRAGMIQAKVRQHHVLIDHMRAGDVSRRLERAFAQVALFSRILIRLLALERRWEVLIGLLRLFVDHLVLSAALNLLAGRARNSIDLAPSRRVGVLSRTMKEALVFFISEAFEHAIG